MTARYAITAARPEDLARLPAIELAAARLLVGHAPASVLDETTSPAVLEKARREGHLWVVRADDVPVGLAHIELIERGVVHLAEVDVHPEHGRRGLGTRVVSHVCHWAASIGYGAVTLTTFRDVPWNMPFYSRLGFGVVPPGQLSPGLRAIVEEETRRGLDPSRRVVMKRPSVSPDDEIAAAAGAGVADGSDDRVNATGAGSSPPKAGRRHASHTHSVPG